MILTCMVPNCGETWEGESPQMCGDGTDCGCLGAPVDPIVCSPECYDKLMYNQYGVKPLIINQENEK